MQVIKRKAAGRLTACRGFSLLEVLVGFVIIAISAVMFLQVMHMFSKETTFYSEHFVASALQEKVLEQCYQEAELNPYGINALGLSDINGNPYVVSTQVTDGQTIFFSRPEIKEESMSVLHELLHDNFMLKINTEKKAGFHEINVSFNWKARYGSGSSESFCRVLDYSLEKEVLTDLDLSDSVVEQRLSARVFSAPGTTLGSNLGSIGAQELVMGIGHVYYACFDLFASADFQQRCKDAEDSETGHSADSSEFAGCTKKHYEITRDVLHLMVCLQPKLAMIKKNIDFIDAVPFKERLIIEGNLQKASKYYTQLRRIFLAGVLKLAERYEMQLNHAKTQREQRAMIGQIFNLYRVLYVNREFCDDVATSGVAANLIGDNFKAFLGRMKTYFSDRDPSVERMATQDEGFIERNELAARYFLPRLLHEICSEIAEFSRIVAGIS